MSAPKPETNSSTVPKLLYFCYESKLGEDDFVQIDPHPMEDESVKNYHPKYTFLTRNCDVFRMYFHISYYTLFLPIKIEFSPKENKFVCTGNTIQKVLCLVLFWIPVWMNYLLLLPRAIDLFLLVETRNATHYFWLLRSIFFMIRSIWFYLMIVNSAPHIANIINITRKKSIQKCRNEVGWRWGFGTVYVGFVMVAFTIVQVLQMFLTLNAIQKNTNVPWLTPLLDFRNERLLQPIDNNPTENFSFWDIFTGSLELWMQTSAHVYYALAQSFFFGPMSITLWYAVRDFVGMIKTIGECCDIEKGSKHLQQDVEDEFNNLRELSDEISQMAGYIQLFTLTVFCLRSIMMLDWAVNFSQLLIADFLVGGLFMIVSLVFAADAYKKMIIFRVWLQNGYTQERFFENEKKFNVLLDQVKSELVGLGKIGVYKLDYAFIAQVLVVSVTLFVIGFEK